MTEFIMTLPGQMSPQRKKLLMWARTLAIITILYNIAEGLVSVYFGVEDETIALFGFGLDSFVEVISGAGVLHLTIRLSRGGSEAQRDGFERTALGITGGAFYLLFGALVLTAAFTLIEGRAPETTLWGVIVGLVSIATMWALIHYKLKVGKALGSQAIIADANCTRACLYLSIILLVSSLLYEMTGLGGIDAAGAILIAWFALKEGREAMEKSRGGSCSCHNDD